MRGYPEFNFPAFDAAAARLRGEGHTVLSPADHDREIGFDEKTAQEAQIAGGQVLKDMILWDMWAVAEADAVYFLKGWEYSAGAKVEHALATFLSKVVEYQNG
jgi:hypothetical protein